MIKRTILCIPFISQIVLASTNCDKVFAEFSSKKFTAQQIINSCSPNGHDQIDDIFRLCYRADMEDKLVKNVAYNCKNAKKACEDQKRNAIWCQSPNAKGTECTCDYHDVYIIPGHSIKDSALPKNDVFN